MGIWRSRGKGIEVRREKLGTQNTFSYLLASFSYLLFSLFPPKHQPVMVAARLECLDEFQTQALG